MHHDKNQKAIFLSLFIVVLLAAGASAAYYFMQKDDGIKSISNFDECAAGHNPVLESYPERCIAPDGRSFTKKY